MFLELGLLFCIFSWRETLNLQLLHGVCSVDTWRAACSWCPRQTLTGAERSMARHGMGSWQPTAPMLTCAAWCYKTITFRLRNYNIVLYGEDYCFQDHMECGAIWKTLAVLSLAVSCHKGSSLNHLSSLISCTNNHHQQLSVLWRHHCCPQRFPTSPWKKGDVAPHSSWPAPYLWKVPWSLENLEAHYPHPYLHLPKSIHQGQELNEKWRSPPPSTALLQHLFFGGADIARKTCSS